MSDESDPQQTPRLELKPESDKDPVPPPPAPSAPPPSSPDEPAGVAPEKVRLKVRVPIQPPEVAPPGESIPVAETPPAVETSAGAEKEEAVARLTLKPKATAPPLSTPPAPTPKTGRILYPPPPPPRAGGGAPVGKNAMGAAATPSIPPPPPVPEPPLLTAVEPKTSSLRLWLMTLALVGFVLLVFTGVGYRTYKKLTAGAVKPPPPTVVQAKPTPPPVTPVTPAAPVTAPGRAVQKARDAVAAVAAKRTTPANEVIGSERGAGSVAPNAPGSAPTPAAATQAAPNGAVPATVVAPSQPFRAFIDRLKISGVRVGPPPRLFLGGVTYRSGDVIDQSLGIVFVSVDVTVQEIIFKDGTGAVVRRRY